VSREVWYLIKAVLDIAGYQVFVNLKSPCTIQEITLTKDLLHWAICHTDMDQILHIKSRSTSRDSR
jgi:hypothetical protein